MDLQFSSGAKVEWPLGKIVCVGRNYAAHAKELNNPLPETPILFIKPATAAADLARGIVLPQGRGECHHELELALLIGRELCHARADQTLAAVAGYGLALDLTLRQLQNELKEKGQPWERAKAFDDALGHEQADDRGACPLSAFVPAQAIGNWQDLQLALDRNGKTQQRGQCRDMLFSIEALLANISESFTLQPGDVVLTGTPAGVGPLCSGDQLSLSLSEGDKPLLSIASSVL